jgi:hypothetical protein
LERIVVTRENPVKGATKVANCKLTPDPGGDPLVFKSAPGNLALKLTPTSGNVTFLLKDTDVLDATGKSVNPTKTPTSLSFTVQAGQTYLLEPQYFIFPTHSTGTLQEDCANGLVLSKVSAVTNPQQFTIRG